MLNQDKLKKDVIIKKTTQGYVVSNSTPKYWSIKFFFVEADAAPASESVWRLKEAKIKHVICVQLINTAISSYVIIKNTRSNKKNNILPPLVFLALAAPTFAEALSSSAASTRLHPDRTEKAKYCYMTLLQEYIYIYIWCDSNNVSDVSSEELWKCFSLAGGTVPGPPSQQTVERPCEGTAAK